MSNKTMTTTLSGISLELVGRMHKVAGCLDELAARLKAEAEPVRACFEVPTMGKVENLEQAGYESHHSDCLRQVGLKFHYRVPGTARSPMASGFSLESAERPKEIEDVLYYELISPADGGPAMLEAVVPAGIDFQVNRDATVTVTLRNLDAIGVWRMKLEAEDVTPTFIASLVKRLRQDPSGAMVLRGEQMAPQDLARIKALVAARKEARVPVAPVPVKLSFWQKLLARFKRPARAIVPRPARRRRGRAQPGRATPAGGLSLSLAA